MAYKSRMNGLGLSSSTTAAAMPKGTTLTTNMGNLGATVKKLAPSNNPGPSTSPSSQGPTQPKSRQSNRTPHGI